MAWLGITGRLACMRLQRSGCTVPAGKPRVMRVCLPILALWKVRGRDDHHLHVLIQPISVAEPRAQPKPSPASGALACQHFVRTSS